MTNPTTRYGYSKIVLGSDNVDVVNDFNNNWDAIDLKMGTQVATSSTRPSSPVQGQWEFETDTGYSRVWKGAAWSSGMTVGTSGSRPANPIQGDELYETDTTITRNRGAAAWNGILPVSVAATLPANPIQGDFTYISDLQAVAYYSGGAWHTCSLIVCTSTTRPTGSSLQTGSVIYETDTLRFLIYNGTTWVNKAFTNFVCTSSTHPGTPFTGLEIYETDTGLGAIYNGTNYMYGVQQIGPTQILGSTTASITFTGIPAVNRLMLAWRTRSSAAGGVFVQMQLDANTGTNYLWNRSASSAGAANMGHSGAAVAQINIGISDATTASYFGSGFTVIDGWNTATGFATCAGSFCNFSSTTSDDAGSTGGQFNVVGPHTSLKVFLSANSFAAGSEFSLYALP